MEYIAIAIIAALVFGVCFLVDKGFTRLFRSQAQHRSGLAVRLSKKYGAIGLILVVLGLAAIFAGGSWLLIAGGVLIILTGIGLTVYYMTCGIFYDADSFLYMSFGKKEKTYAYGDITAQQLYNNAGTLLIELHMADGSAVQLQSSMPGAFDFMDHAFSAWLRQTGREEADCSFHDPANSCWFPPVEG